jgi:hypothetical protein
MALSPLPSSISSVFKEKMLLDYKGLQIRRPEEGGWMTEARDKNIHRT